MNGRLKPPAVEFMKEQMARMQAQTSLSMSDCHLYLESMV